MHPADVHMGRSSAAFALRALHGVTGALLLPPPPSGQGPDLASRLDVVRWAGWAEGLGLMP